MDITLKCCVVDDEPLARGLICSFVEKTPFLSLEASFASASEAIKCVLEKKVDLLFLDIQMPELNGIEFAKIIPPDAASSLSPLSRNMRSTDSATMPLTTC